MLARFLGTERRRQNWQSGKCWSSTPGLGSHWPRSPRIMVGSAARGCPRSGPGLAQVFAINKAVCTGPANRQNFRSSDMTADSASPSSNWSEVPGPRFDERNQRPCRRSSSSTFRPQVRPSLNSLIRLIRAEFLQPPSLSLDETKSDHRCASRIGKNCSREDRAARCPAPASITRLHAAHRQIDTPA